jgi:hypothetical protein
MRIGPSKYVATPLWDKCEDETHTPKSEKLESSGTLKNSELDCRGQNTSHWNVLDVIGKVLNFKCPKWPRMSHLDICSPSYGQKKGQESNWQFDSRPLKVENGYDPDVCRRSADGDRKLLRRAITSVRPHPNQMSEPEDMNSQSPGSPTLDSFGTPLGSPGKKCHSDVASVESYREYYMGKVVASPSSNRGESSESNCTWLVPTPKLTCRIGWFWMQDCVRL